jgi:hypothetical protein
MLLAVTIVIAVSVVAGSLGLRTPASAAALTARLTWATAALLFIILFVFTLVACPALMFACGKDVDAMFATGATFVLGVIAVVVCVWNRDGYLGPANMHDLLTATAFCRTGVRWLTASFDGFAIWSTLLVIATSSVIARNQVKTEADLSRQLRGSILLMYIASALLIAGVAETSSLHKWPANDHLASQSCPLELPPSWQGRSAADFATEVDTTATAISTSVGTVFSLVLIAAYLPLAILLRQRAYRVVTPFARTEAWLGVHGFALQPTQQLSKVMLILSPLLAGGPVSYLITLLSR